MNISDYIVATLIISYCVVMIWWFIKWLIRRIIDTHIDEQLETVLKELRDRAGQVSTIPVLMPSPLTPEEQAALEEQEKIDAGEDIEPDMPDGITNREELYEKVLKDIVNNWDHESDAHKYKTSCRVCMAGLALDGKNPWK